MYRKRFHKSIFFYFYENTSESDDVHDTMVYEKY